MDGWTDDILYGSNSLLLSQSNNFNGEEEAHDSLKLNDWNKK